MNKTAFYKKNGKLFGFVFSICLILSSLTAKAQDSGITLSMHDATVAQVIKEIEKQTRYVFFYNDIDINRKVDVNIQNKNITETLNLVFKDSDVSWKIDGLQVILSRKNVQSGPLNVTGTVLDAAGNPIIGAAVLVKGTTIGASTGIDGSYTLQIPPPRCIGRSGC